MLFAVRKLVQRKLYYMREIERKLYKNKKNKNIKKIKKIKKCLNTFQNIIYFNQN